MGHKARDHARTADEPEAQRAGGPARSNCIDTSFDVNTVIASVHYAGRMAETAPVGRRERKKAATRAAIVSAATEMFLERGFDQVSVREIADRADVSPTTVFTHFPQKESLVFHQEDEDRRQLLDAVRERPAGSSISHALAQHYRAEIDLLGSSSPEGELRRRLVTLTEKTPSLGDYAGRMWLRHEDALAMVIAEELHLPEPNDEIRIYARFALQIQLFTTDSADPIAALRAGFEILDQGWSQYVQRIG